jgi:hypothetical protein
VTLPARCKNAGDDPAHGKRPAPYVGPRCSTCHRRRRVALSIAAHARRLLAKFRITVDQYAAIYLAQGGVCYVCRRATGATKRLAVDHDHWIAETLCDHPTDEGCPQCIRGLACGPCNQDVLGRLGGRPETYERIATALRNPPARKVLLP